MRLEVVGVREVELIVPFCYVAGECWVPCHRLFAHQRDLG